MPEFCRATHRPLPSLFGRGLCCAGCGHHVGREVGRAVFVVADRAESFARADAWRVHLNPRRDRRRADHRCGRETL